MFVAFIVQIAFRYLFNFPIGWTSELTVITWLWLVLWGAAFVRQGKRGNPLRPRLFGASGRRTRIAIIGIITAICDRDPVWRLAPGNVRLRQLHEGREDLLPEDPHRLAVLDLRDLPVAIIARYVWLLWHLLRGKDAREADSTKVSSGL